MTPFGRLLLLLLYIYLLCIQLLVVHGQQVYFTCPNQCSGHGHCAQPSNVCSCFNGYTGPDCSQKTCPFGGAWTDIAIGVDNAHNLAECSNNGICDRGSGICNCRTYFTGTTIFCWFWMIYNIFTPVGTWYLFNSTGKACEKLQCFVGCNKRGKCESMQYYAMSKDPGYGTVYDYSANWDATQVISKATAP